MAIVEKKKPEEEAAEKSRGEELDKALEGEGDGSKPSISGIPMNTSHSSTSHTSGTSTTSGGKSKSVSGSDYEKFEELQPHYDALNKAYADLSETFPEDINANGVNVLSYDVSKLYVGFKNAYKEKNPEYTGSMYSAFKDYLNKLKPDDAVLKSTPKRNIHADITRYSRAKTQAALGTETHRMNIANADGSVTTPIQKTNINALRKYIADSKAGKITPANRNGEYDTFLKKNFGTLEEADKALSSSLEGDKLKMRAATTQSRIGAGVGLIQGADALRRISEARRERKNLQAPDLAEYTPDYKRNIQLQRNLTDADEKANIGMSGVQAQQLENQRVRDFDKGFDKIVQSGDGASVRNNVQALFNQSQDATLKQAVANETIKEQGRREREGLTEKQIGEDQYIEKLGRTNYEDKKSRYAQELTAYNNAQTRLGQQEQSARKSGDTALQNVADGLAGIQEAYAYNRYRNSSNLPAYALQNEAYRTAAETEKLRAEAAAKAVTDAEVPKVVLDADGKPIVKPADVPVPITETSLAGLNAQTRSREGVYPNAVERPRTVLTALDRRDPTMPYNRPEEVLGSTTLPNASLRYGDNHRDATPRAKLSIDGFNVEKDYLPTTEKPAVGIDSATKKPYLDGWTGSTTADGRRIMVDPITGKPYYENKSPTYAGGFRYRRNINAGEPQAPDAAPKTAMTEAEQEAYDKLTPEQKAAAIAAKNNNEEKARRAALGKDERNKQRLLYRERKIADMKKGGMTDAQIAVAMGEDDAIYQKENAADYETEDYAPKTTKVAVPQVSPNINLPKGMYVAKPEDYAPKTTEVAVPEGSMDKSGIPNSTGYYMPNTGFPKAAPIQGIGMSQEELKRKQEEERRLQMTRHSLNRNLSRP